MVKKVVAAILILTALSSAGCQVSEKAQNLSPAQTDEGDAAEIDRQLRAIIDEQEITGLEFTAEPDPRLVALGQALFFDKILSGNRDISCATCHHPSLASGDALSLPVGTGGSGLGAERLSAGEGHVVPRNSPDIIGRGSTAWTSMFWDSRVAVDAQGQLTTPAGGLLPEGLDGLLAAQAMFPVTSRAEMRGFPVTEEGANELARIDDDDLQAIWDGLMERLMANEEYAAMFQEAYPDLQPHEFGFQHAANAIAAFETKAFSFSNSPWDRYVAGDSGAMDANMIRGALLFFGEAGCTACHSGPLLSDQQHHVLAAPQVGPGKELTTPWDTGRMEVTGNVADRFAFRTPSLRNVTRTGPWMHDGSFSTLEAVIRHHLNPAESLRSYDPDEHLPQALQADVLNDEKTLSLMISHVDPLLDNLKSLTGEEIDEIVVFLECLSDEEIDDLTWAIPESVPSGLPVID